MFTIGLNGLSGKFGWLGVTGQSGAGKESFTTILKRVLEEKNIPYISIVNGDIIRQISSENNYLADVVRAVNNQGKKISQELCTSLWLNYLRTTYTGNELIIHDGAPRWPTDIDIMTHLVGDGYMPPPIMIEVCADSDICRQRLIERTLIDKREDLSIDGKPGEPDEEKISTKLGWYARDREDIVRTWVANGAYVSFLNNGTLGDLEEKIRAVF